MLSRRRFLHTAFWTTAGVLFEKSSRAAQFKSLPSPDFVEITHSKPEWNSISKGLDFARVEIYRKKEVVDAIAVLRIDPNQNKIRVFNSFDYEKTQVRTIEGWQVETGAIAMINSAQYMADPYYMPCALVICDGKQKGPKSNQNVRGMFVAEPVDTSLPKANLLDFDYDKFNLATTSYSQGVQHWPILLDRRGKIKVTKTDWQANRTVVAKDFDNNIVFFTTEGGFFTLYHFGLFLKEQNKKTDHGFKIHTAMNMDGGYEANMIVKSEKMSYLTYGAFETDGVAKNVPFLGLKARIPGVIGVFPRV